MLRSFRARGIARQCDPRIAHLECRPTGIAGHLELEVARTRAGVERSEPQRSQRGRRPSAPYADTVIGAVTAPFSLPRGQFRQHKSNHCAHPQSNPGVEVCIVVRELLPQFFDGDTALQFRHICDAVRARLQHGISDRVEQPQFEGEKLRVVKCGAVTGNDCSGVEREERPQRFRMSDRLNDIRNRIRDDIARDEQLEYG